MNNTSANPSEIKLKSGLQMGRAFKEAWGVFKDNWSRLLVLQVIGAGVILGGYTLLIIAARFLSQNPELLRGGYTDELPLVVGVCGVVLAALLITYVWVMASSACFVFRSSTGEKPAIKTVLKDGWKSVGHLLLYCLLISGAVGFVLAVIAIPLAPYLISLSKAEDARVFLLALLVLLLLAGIRLLSWWLWVKLGFGPFAVTVEKKDALKALSRSWLLSRGNFWRTFGVLVVIQIGVYILTRILAYVVSLTSRFEMPDIFSTEIFSVNEASLEGLAFMGIMAAGFQIIKGMTLWPVWGSLYDQLRTLNSRKSSLIELNSPPQSKRG